jgi:hypothetical protein
MKHLIFACLFILSVSATAQYNWEFGLDLGGANYLGDIGGKELSGRDYTFLDMHLSQTNIAFGAYGRYKFNKRLAVHANLTYFKIEDFDSESTNPARVARNLNFRNRMLELGLRGELTIFYDNDVGGKGYYNPSYKLYLFGGISGFRSNPQGQILYDPNNEFADVWYDLRPMRTEDTGNGQYEEYGYYGVAIPAGMGMYFTFDKKWRIGWELSWRTTFTDYLDDISTVYGNPELMSPEGVAFYSQSNQTLINEIADPSAGSIDDHRYVDGFPTKRGDASENDSYVTASFSVGRVIRGRSAFFNAKYSWLKSRSGRRSRAKF